MLNYLEVISQNKYKIQTNTKLNLKELVFN
jgi:hypothetical protein